MFDSAGKNQINIIPRKHMEECKHLEQQTFCNSLTTLAMYKGDECWNNIVFNANASICPYKTIQNDNYFIPLGQNGTFLYVIQPTQVRMVCNSITTFHNITDHKIISFENNCDVFHAMDFDPKTYFENTTTRIQLTKPKFSTEENGNWHKFIEIDSLHVETEEKTTKNKKPGKAIPEEPGFFDSIGNFFADIFIEPIKRGLSFFETITYVVYVLIIITGCMCMNVIWTICIRVRDLFKK